ncbi:MAG: adenylyl-sulfate kinase [Vulcanimicrobiaceae bacterium]
MQQQLRVVAVGHVDHGKSTLIGRLLHDSGNLPDGKVDELRGISGRRGVDFEWSFVLDAMQSERDLAVTIDTTRLWMRTPERDVVLIDAPGHKEFLRNMVTGASDADAALLLVDAHDGVSEQTRRHALLLELIGVDRVVVAINKMDRVAYAQARYDEIRCELEALLGRIGIAAAAFVPASARNGENIVDGSTTMPWYDGPTIFASLLALPSRARRGNDALRIAVQGVIRRDLERTLLGRVESGEMHVGDEVLIAPAMRRARIASIDSWPHGRTHASAGESIGFVLDGPLYVDRGDLIASVAHPPTLATSFRARLLWLGTRPLSVGEAFRMRFGTRTAAVEVAAFERVVDINALDVGTHVRAQTNDVAEVVLRSREPLPLDAVDVQPGLARFILLDGIDIVAGGTILTALENADNVVPVGHLLDRDARARRTGHRGTVVWLTGLPAAGKSTIAMELERRLFERGMQTYVLDGDNLRTGLCADLGFGPSDRSENIRRVAEVASLFADAGTIAIAAFISPARADRERARGIVGDAFAEVYVRADAAACERRDPKGHYRKARAGEFPGFTGLSGDYEVPESPDLILDTETLSVDDAVTHLEAFVRERVSLGVAALH